MDLITLLLTAVLSFIPASYFFKFFSRRFKFIRLINKLPGPPALPLLSKFLTPCGGWKHQTGRFCTTILHSVLAIRKKQYNIYSELLRLVDTYGDFLAFNFSRKKRLHSCIMQIIEY
uniref:Uncharacterized protein n=1 Tax=Cacopsylla melanoneura TaxID=428564 RepID=A0A8D9E7C0_9HEMI